MLLTTVRVLSLVSRVDGKLAGINFSGNCFVGSQDKTNVPANHVQNEEAGHVKWMKIINGRVVSTLKF